MLWLLRHADAADGDPDDARPLTEKGIRHARAAGQALAQMGVRLDACLASPKLRALQTAELACEPLGVTVSLETRLAGGPFEPEELLAGLQDAMLVGHDPSISLALHDLTGVHSRMSKGGLAGINKGELIVLLRPRELTLMAGVREPVA
ncbi:MAG TPA: phosphoglycerate mutase family protein [Solirubrobacteraceae bacterium]|jgi:phosphohistidine phosphatase|nr:phosphoglycerate mutase family protein [Solirubrobacteraceae bacterium]